jgi:hypothetical protein
MLPSLLILEETYLSDSVSNAKSRAVPPKLERGITALQTNHLLPFADKLIPLDQFTADFRAISE